MALLQLSSIIFLTTAYITEGYIFIVFILSYPVLYLINLYYKLQRAKKSQPWLPSNNNNKDEEPKVVLITGASSGIGESLAYEFAKHKTILVLCARRIDLLTNVVEKNCMSLGATKVISVRADVTKEEDINKLIKVVETNTATNGRLDCLVLNAGVSMGETLESLKDFELIKNIMDINFFGSSFLAYRAIPLLKKNPLSKSRIVIVSSLLGFVPGPLRTGYCASKFALKGYFESLQHELAPYDIFITMAYPGAVVTEINKNRLGENPKDLDMKNAISSEECARTIFKSVCRGDREVVFMATGKFARLVEGIFPDLLFNIVSRLSQKYFKKRT